MEMKIIPGVKRLPAAAARILVEVVAVFDVAPEGETSVCFRPMTAFGTYFRFEMPFHGLLAHLSWSRTLKVVGSSLRNGQEYKTASSGSLLPVGPTRLFPLRLSFP